MVLYPGLPLRPLRLGVRKIEFWAGFFGKNKTAHKCKPSSSRFSDPFLPPASVISNLSQFDAAEQRCRTRTGLL
jgi:hypothetical protein